jgi:hypothetical protein
MPPPRLSDLTEKPIRGATEEAREGALIESRPALVPPRDPAGEAAPTYACRRHLGDLERLVKELLDCSSVSGVLAESVWQNGASSGLEFDFVYLKGGNRHALWGLRERPFGADYEALPESWRTQHPDPNALPLVRFRQQAPDQPDRDEPSESFQKLEALRQDARLHVRLFTEVVAKALPEWGTENADQLRQMTEWTAGWPADFRFARFPTVADEKPRLTQHSFTLDVDDTEITKRLKKWLSAPDTCASPRIRVHFKHAQPKTATQADGVLEDPAELDKALVALAQVRDQAIGPLELVITGAADKSDDAARNVKLSERRALWVLERVKHLGFAKAQTVAVGETRAGDGPDEELADRWVEMTVSSP